MKASETDIVWTPVDGGGANPGDVRTERHNSDWQRTRGDLWVGAAKLYGGDSEKAPSYDSIKEMLAIFVNFHTLVVRDGIDPLKAHEAFRKIDEYATTISRDTPGAKD